MWHFLVPSFSFHERRRGSLALPVTKTVAVPRRRQKYIAVRNDAHITLIDNAAVAVALACILATSDPQIITAQMNKDSHICMRRFRNLTVDRKCM